MGKQKTNDVIGRHIGFNIIYGRDWKSSIVSTLLCWTIDFIPYGLAYGSVVAAKYIWGFEWAMLYGLALIFYQTTKGKYGQE